MSETDKLDRIKARETVSALRKRVTKAEAAGQVELHVALADVHLIVGLSEALFEILDSVKRGRA